MLKLHRYTNSFLLEKCRNYNNTDNSFVVMMFCNSLCGIFDNPGQDSVALRVGKLCSIIFTVFYCSAEVGSLCYFKPFALKYFNILFMTFGRVLCLIGWTSLAVYRRELKQIWMYLLDTQRNGPDDRRRKFIRYFNWSTLVYLIFGISPTVAWFFNRPTESPLQFFESQLIDKLNTVLNPIAGIILTLLFMYSIIVVCSILSALSLEVGLLGHDFSHIFDTVDILNSTDKWNQVLQAFKQCVYQHQLLLKTAAALRLQLKSYFLAQLSVYFLIIVFCSFLYIYNSRSDVGNVTFAVFAVVTQLSNLMLYGFLCDQLEEQVAAINYCLYCSAWSGKMIFIKQFRRQYKTLRQLILVVMGRTHKKIGFTCERFFEMSLQTCRSVLWFAYSALTVLLVTFLE